MNVRYNKNSKIVEIRDVGKLFNQAQLEQVVVNLQNLRIVKFDVYRDDTNRITGFDIRSFTDIGYLEIESLFGVLSRTDSSISDTITSIFECGIMPV